MSKSYWRSPIITWALVVSAGLIAATLTSLTLKGDYRADGLSKTDQQAAKLKRLNNPRMYTPPCDQPESAEEADLCAQREMAEAARDLYDVSYLQLVISTLGFGALLYSLLLTRHALAEARRSSDAAQATANVALAIELPIIQPRWGATEVGDTDAFVDGNEPYACTPLAQPNASRFLVIYEIRFRNFGRTVAIPTQIEVGYDFCAELPPFSSYHIRRTFEGNEVIAEEPQEEAFRAGIDMGIEISEETAAAWIEGAALLWIYCALTYRDFLGTAHVSRFCARWHHRSDGGGSYYFASDGNLPDSYTN